VTGTSQHALVGVAGYFGRPTADGVVEIGYAIAVEHQGRGYATEAVDALLDRAFADPNVRVVVATTYAMLKPSIQVLEKTGFIVVSHTTETGLLRFEQRRAASRAVT
jgi:RimJ/RimL family protein N-acetyltransferase